MKTRKISEAANEDAVRCEVIEKELSNGFIKIECNNNIVTIAEMNYKTFCYINKFSPNLIDCYDDEATLWTANVHFDSDLKYTLVRLVGGPQKIEITLTKFVEEEIV